MRFYPSDASRYLLDPADVDGESLPAALGAYKGPLTQIVSWSRDFLCHPHPDLGREGSVCPYTEPSLVRNLYWLTIYPGPSPTMGEVREAVMAYREWFLELAPVAGRDSRYKAILILFPDLAADVAPDIIDTIQAALKSEFIPKGLMIGQFHMVSDEPGLRNPNFRPLRTSVPLLAIRHMVSSDFPFLKKKPEWVSSYIEQFGLDLPRRIRAEVEETARAYNLPLPETQNCA